ncbi:hypothetical protein LF1_16750 [Rubripirellula obstinata]|uniref:Uncharacterized protein n=1 Tax=Rubripirellula obstinata TaxID=406547 RepID=A0A5B1CDE1_9BACT|nr:hypothetical protein LF1_16750 [Rubripirellula obstinata]
MIGVKPYGSSVEAPQRIFPFVLSEPTARVGACELKRDKSNEETSPTGLIGHSHVKL